MSVTEYLKWFEDHPGKMTDTYTHLGSSDADTVAYGKHEYGTCLLYTSPSPRDKRQSRMPSSA